MNTHRIIYDVIDGGRRYTATCRCGSHRESRSPAQLSKWGPEHVIRAYEREH